MLGSPVTHTHTHTRTHTQTHTHESDYCGQPFRVSGVFPSTYHQGSAKKKKKKKAHASLDFFLKA